MLFSQVEVAAFINANFEPAWESVRSAPLVRIDFGNGTTVTRTLHGNIASYNWKMRLTHRSSREEKSGWVS